MENIAKNTLNPWLSIWLKPRMTMRQMLQEKAAYPILWLAVVGGITDIIAWATLGNLGDTFPLPVIILGSVLFGAIQSLLILYIGSAILFWTGKWIGGHGSYADIRAAIAWSRVPVIWGIILWIAQFIFFGREMFMSITPRIDSSLILALSFIAFSLLDLIVGIWALVVYFNCLAEAQGFSGWKAFLNNFLAGIITGGGWLLALALLDLIISVIKKEGLF